MFGSESRHVESRTLDMAPRNALTEERRNAAFLVVLCSLCCLWVFQGGQYLGKSTDVRQSRLIRLWELRREAQAVTPGAGPRHLRELDGLFTGYRVVLHREAAGPVLRLEPRGTGRSR